MQIINVIKTLNGIISQIQSFTIVGGNEEEKQIVVEQYEKCFLDMIKEKEPYLSKVDELDYIESAYYEANGYEVQIIWSHNIVEQKLDNTSYFLFGADACRILEESGEIEDVLKVDSYEIYEHHSNDSLGKFFYDGWEGYVELSKEQYDFLLKNQKV